MLRASCETTLCKAAFFRPRRHEAFSLGSLSTTSDVCGAPEKNKQGREIAKRRLRFGPSEDEFDFLLLALSLTLSLFLFAIAILQLQTRQTRLDISP